MNPVKIETLDQASRLAQVSSTLERHGNAFVEAFEEYARCILLVQNDANIHLKIGQDTLRIGEATFTWLQDFCFVSEPNRSNQPMRRIVFKRMLANQVTTEGDALKTIYIDAQGNVSTPQCVKEGTIKFNIENDKAHQFKFLRDLLAGLMAIANPDLVEV